MSHISSPASSVSSDFNKAQSLYAVIGALEVLSNAFREARDNSVATGCTLLNAVLPPDFVNYLIFASSVVDSFVKNNDLSKPISDDAMVESSMSETLEEITTRPVVSEDPSSSSIVNECIPHEQSYLQTTVGVARVQWIEAATDQLSGESEDEHSPAVCDPAIKHESADMPRVPSHPCSQPPAPASDSHLFMGSAPGWQSEFVTGPITYAYPFHDAYRPPNHSADNVDFQHQQARASWLAEHHEQISRDLAKSPLLTSFIPDKPPSLPPMFTDLLTPSSMVHHPRPMHSPNFHPILSYSQIPYNPATTPQVA